MLELENVHVRLGAFPVLRGVSLSVEAGQIAGLVGRNGAGKTTTMRSIMGLVPVQSGAIQLDGQDLLRVPPYRRVLEGIGYVPEDRRLVGPLTVEENILVPAWATNMPDPAERLALVYQLLPEVKELARRRAAQLSGGQQKMVALGRALMTGRKLLLLDEPFEGLAPALAEKFGQVISSLQEQGPAILIAESDQRLLGTLANRMYTIERGEIIMEKSPA